MISIYLDFSIYLGLIDDSIPLTLTAQVVAYKERRRQHKLRNANCQHQHYSIFVIFTELIFTSELMEKIANWKRNYFQRSNDFAQQTVAPRLLPPPHPTLQSSHEPCQLTNH